MWHSALLYVTPKGCHDSSDSVPETSEDVVDVEGDPPEPVADSEDYESKKKGEGGE